jgi:acrylyl-CoA reductase (NADPH)
MFRALLLDKSDDAFTCELTDLDDADLPEHPVTVDVEYSTVNYKDGLAMTGSPGVVREWPMVPGIDLAGTVVESSDPAWTAGDRVTVNGWELGEKHWGGYAGRARVEPGWLTRLPDGISTHQAAAIGTAGYTAMLCVLALEEHGVTPDAGPVIVTGAAGGVGSVAVAVLAKLGYAVTASTGRRESEGDYLRGLGASDVVDRATLDGKGRPLDRAVWAGGVDAVGSQTLANVLSQTLPHGCVAACGLAQGPDLPGTVLPFILRGVTLAGVNSVLESPTRRDQAWSRLATDLDTAKLEAMTSTVPLAEAPAIGAAIIEGQIRGRVVVDIQA